MEIQNVLENDLNISKKQSNFLQTTLGKVINNTIDVGLRYVLPDLIENEVIEVKNALINNGLKEGINTAIDKAVSLGKSAMGIITGNFENVEQIRTAIKTGGIIDSVSGVIDNVVEKAHSNGNINNNVTNLIKQGKNIIVNDLSNSLEKTLSKQASEIEQIKSYLKVWNQNYKENNFEKMEEAYKYIQKNMQKLIPIEETINKVREMEIIHNLIKNNGHNFDITEEQLRAVSNLSK